MYIDVILPLPLRNRFTYTVADADKHRISIGIRVVVPFGKKKMYTAIVSLIHSNQPEHYEAKEIIEILDDYPIVRPPQLKFWNWISDYYLSTIGEVYQSAIPTGLKIGSETQVVINEEFEESADEPLTQSELKLLSILADAKIHSVNELNRLVGVKNSMRTLKQLLEKNAIETSEELTRKYQPKTATYVRISSVVNNEDALRQIFSELERAKKQLEILMKYIELSKCLSANQIVEISKKELLTSANGSLSALGGLVEKGILELYQKEIGRLDATEIKTEPISKLNAYQQEALNKINQQFKEKNTVLLHGVTSSGKTEIYIHLINSVLQANKQVLYLVPEIALTTQLTNRLKKVFGNKLGIYHSRFSDAERVEIWNDLLLNKNYQIIIGVRSSIFLPFRRLGLVIVDEEHESSYKQHNSAPRYHARNSAIVLASMHGAKTLLGTATPSIESYYNAKTEKYGLVELSQRFQDMEMPEIIIEDSKEAYRKKQMEGHFTPILKEKIGKALQNNEQVILFQNRRGFAPYLECKMCNHIPKCQNCDVSLTIHKYMNKLTCHYCGYTENLPQNCPKCGTPSLENRGFGTEKIEDEIKDFFPTARTKRMDLDSTRTKKSYQKIINNFETGKIDILIGTQMITKGLDFERVSLVGIMNADNMLNFPDFRADERAYQLMEQVSGRAGRKYKRGTVVLQTSNPKHPVVEQVVEYNYKGMYENQLEERQLFSYPPFFRLVEITLKHRDFNVCNDASEQLGKLLRQTLKHRVNGPNIPLVGKIKNLYLKQLLIKVENEISFAKTKQIIQENIDYILRMPQFKSVRVSIDVEPM